MTKLCTNCKIEKDTIEFGKHSRSKDGLYYLCKKCKSDNAKLRYTYNKEHMKNYYANNKEHMKNYYANNKEKLKEYSKRYYLDNKEELKVKRDIYTENNKEKLRKRNNEWSRNNRGTCNAINAKRKAAKIERTVVWADSNKIKEFYIEAKRLTKETGIEYHVDHIIPLQGENVSGLHVESNLQVITATENKSKNNKF